MYPTFSDLKKLLKQNTDELKKIKVALLGDTATQFLNVALRGSAINAGFTLEIFEADFGQISRQVLDPSSEFYEFEPDYTIVFESSHKLLGSFYKQKDAPLSFAQNKLQHIEELYQTIQSRTKGE